MRPIVAVPVTALVLALPACSGSSAVDQLPSGTFAGSTAGDAPFVLEVGQDIKVNRRKARLVEEGVVELKAAGVGTRLECSVQDEDGEELRCTVRTTPPTGAPTTEVIDLMLL